MSSQPHRVLTSKKRKVEPFCTVKPAGLTSPSCSESSAVEPGSSNLLLAGYMAHEYLTRGTLMGQRWDPGRAEAVPLCSNSGESKKLRGSQAGPSRDESSMEKPNRSYAEVTTLLKSDGVHIPGIVNPTQLAKWIRM